MLDEDGEGEAEERKREVVEFWRRVAGHEGEEEEKGGGSQ